MNKTIIILIAIAIPLTIYLSSFSFYAFNLSFYEKEFEKYNSPEESKEITKNLLGYFKDKNELNKNNFNEREISHLLDVKNLVQRFLLIKNILLTTLIILFGSLYLTSKKTFTDDSLKAIIAGSISTIVIFVFGFLFFLNFSVLFENFHQVFFQPGTWIFSQNDTLIKLFPLGFFSDITARISLLSLITAIVLLIPSYLKKQKK